MNRIYNSASKLTLIILILTLCILTSLAVFFLPEQSTTVVQLVQIFGMAVSGVIGYYFGDSNSKKDGQSPTI